MHEHYLYSKISVIAEDNSVVIDGLGLQVDCSDLPYFVHAIQWDGKQGELEFKAGPNGVRPAPMTIVDLKPFHFLLDRWDMAAGTHHAAEAKRKVGLEVHAKKVREAEEENKRVEADIARAVAENEAGLKAAAVRRAELEEAALQDARREAGL
jgi:hypothetical protein